jgi:methylmalonyl-CoA mutase
MGLFDTFDKVSHQEWLDKVKEDLKGKDFENTLVWNSPEGINVQPFYNGESVSVYAGHESPSEPWKIRTTIVIDSAEKANRIALSALEGGANSILFIGSVKDEAEMNVLLSNIQTELIDVHFYSPEPLHIQKMVSMQQGSVSYDYLSALLEKNDPIPEGFENELLTLLSSNNDMKHITVNGYYYSQSGFSLTQELAFSLNQAVEYFNLLTDKGIDSNQIAAKIQFIFGVNTNYFFEIAKLRAARKLWSLMLKAYKAEDIPMTIHSETLENSENEDKNYQILRNTTMAMSAILGGCNSLNVAPHDSSKSMENFSNRIARNVQLILKEESFLDKVNNPADGAYYIEQLTDELAKNAWELFKEVEQEGGFLSCVKKGLIKV